MSDYYADDPSKIIYLTRQEKRRCPDMMRIGPDHGESSESLSIMGRVEIDNSLCNGCKLCVEACPAHTLEMTGKTRVAMKGINPSCIGCGDCIPICLPKAISIKRFQQYKGRYKFIGRGEASEPRKF